MTDTVLACPECDSCQTRIIPNKKHQCKNCGARFDDHVVREHRGTHSDPARGLARTLDEMDPDELATDGGQSIPDGWELIEPAGPYSKLVKRDAVTVPKLSGRESFHRDSVVVMAEETVGVAKGPGARQTWGTNSPETLGPQLAQVIEEWIANDGDPYGGEDLDNELDRVVYGRSHEQATLTEVDA